MRAKSFARPAPPRPFNDLLQAAIRELRDQRDDGARDTVLFLGQRHQSFPILIIEDPILEPVDKIIWMVIWLRGAAGGTRALFPSYAELAAKTQIRSDTTIARALAILRATRWLSLCARVRGSHGKFRGNVYAVHDEPLALADTVHLDPEYLTFIDAAKEHAHPRVVKIAESVSRALDSDIQAGHDVTAPPHAISRRLEAAQAIATPGSARYFSFTPEVLRDLANTRELSTDVDRLQDLETVGSSSININKTTTTEDKSPATARDPACVYPPGLTENQRLLADRYLERVPAADRQIILDELEGRLRAARKGAKPLYDPIRYLHRLCAERVAGRFVVNLGSDVAAERHRRQRRPPSESPPRISTDPLNPRRPVAEEKPGMNPVDAIRRQFKIPSGLKSPS